MKTTAKITFFGIQDILRSKWGIMYALLFFIITEGLFQFGGGAAKVLLSLTNITLILVPLISVIFGTMYFYNSREFIELLLTQPVKRSTVYLGMFVALACSLGIGYVAGVIVPFLLHGAPANWNFTSYVLLNISAICLTCVFVGLSFVVSLQFDDKGKGLGVAILAWLFFAVIYDGAVLLIVNLFSDYPLEKPVIVLTLLNPIDLARIVLLIQTDISALMGYTGAVFERFFGSINGILLSLIALLVWSSLPFSAGLVKFSKKDF